MKIKHPLLLCAGNPDTLQCRGGGETATFEIAAASADAQGVPPLPKVAMTAYNGGKMALNGWRFPVVVDISGMTVPAQSIPIRLGHDAAQGVGHTTQITMTADKITATGLVSRSTSAASEVVSSGAKGFPWQASMGAKADSVEWVPEGKSAQCNGKTFEGPINVIRKSTLAELSLVDLGADTTTSANVAAAAALSGESKMDFAKWLAAKGFKETDFTPEKLTELRAQFDAEIKAGTADATVATAAATSTVTAGADSPDVAKTIRAQAAAETKRIAAVTKICGVNIDLQARAIEENWDETKTELEAMREERKTISARAPGAIIGADKQFTGKMLECSMAQALGMKEIEKRFDAPTLDAAHKRFRGNMGLQSLLMEAAWANGFTGRSFDGSDLRDVLRAAFSTMSLPGILSNNMNKFLLDSFNAVEQTWRSIAGIRSVRDFKQASSYRLGGDMQYDQVGPQGELKNGSVAEVSYTNQVQTYGKLFSVSRQDIINDDLGALSAAPKRLGRGAALKINDIFWTKFLSNPSNFFGTGHANYFSGAGSVLAIAGLTQAEQAFFDQTDPEGKPLGYMPKTLLVPNSLNAVASALMRSLEIRDTTASTKYPTTNPHAGKFDVQRSAYLNNAAYTGYSATAWYLLANPAELATIEMAFLNGQENPVIESTEADFDQLGIRFRGYHDFGVSLQEYRAGVMNAGA